MLKLYWVEIKSRDIMKKSIVFITELNIETSKCGKYCHEKCQFFRYFDDGYKCYADSYIGESLQSKKVRNKIRYIRTDWCKGDE